MQIQDGQCLGSSEQRLYIGEIFTLGRYVWVYSQMTTAGQVCAGHTHAPRLEGRSSCPAGGTSPKGKGKAKDGLPLPDCPSEPGGGVSHLWRGTHLEGMPKRTFSYPFRLHLQAPRDQLCLLYVAQPELRYEYELHWDALCGIVCRVRPFSLHMSLPACVNVFVQLHGALARPVSQQNRPYLVHVLLFAELKQLKEEPVVPGEHDCVDALSV